MILFRSGLVKGCEGWSIFNWMLMLCCFSGLGLLDRVGFQYLIIKRD